jgi:hypothetical protein
MTAAPKLPGIATALVRPALWFCASNLLAAVLAAQCVNVSQVPNQTISSGTSCYSNTATLTATGVTINGSASVNFVAGQTPVSARRRARRRPRFMPGWKQRHR